MRIEIRAIGRLKAGAERDLMDRYGQRIQNTGRGAGITALEIRESVESRASSVDKRKREEADVLSGGLPPQAYRIALDERGKSPNSQKFAEKLKTLAEAGTGDLVFFIGGADGLDDALRREAHETISFGAMTWPHQIVRVLLAEQIYRAITILTGHPYHRS